MKGIRNLNPLSNLETFLRRNIFLVAFLAVSLSLSLFSWKYVEQIIHRRTELEFEIQCQRIQKLIENRLELYLDALYGTQAFFAASQSVERDEWHVFVEAQKLRERYPGISALRYIERVELKDRDKFINDVRKDVSLTPQGYPDFSIHPAVKKPEYYVVKYVEPSTDNEAMLGQDLGFEPVRLEALEKARDSGQPQVTGQIMLDADRSPAFLIGLPIYRNGLPRRTVQERREALAGFLN